MKYTRPAYINEEIETVDVICTSYDVAWVPVTNAAGEVQKDEQGNTIMKTVVSVDVGRLF